MSIVGVAGAPARAEVVGSPRESEARLARRLLEEGRLRYLREHGWDARLVRYVDASVTPDNLAIIATKR